MDSSKSAVLTRLVSFDALKVLIGLYIAQFIVVKAYWLFIYPYYVSPLRHLPGPKVSQQLKSSVLPVEAKDLAAYAMLGPPFPHRSGNQPVQEWEPQ